MLSYPWASFSWLCSVGVKLLAAARLHEPILYQGLSILILAEASGVVYYNIQSQLAFLCITVGMTVIYTLLVVGRLLRYRRQTESFVSKEHLRTYDEVMTMVVESAVVYSIFGVIFIISFALHTYISNLVFLSISHVQVGFKFLNRVTQMPVSYLGHCATFHYHPCCSGTCCRFPDWDPPRNHGLCCGRPGSWRPSSRTMWDWNSCSLIVNIMKIK